MNIAKLCPREDLGFCNCYVVGDEGSPCFVVDPGYNGNGFLHRYIEKHHQGKCLGFLLTHAHYDHIFGLVDYPGAKDIPVFINAVEAEKLSDPRLNLSGRHGVPVIELTDLSVYAFEDEDQIKLGDTVIEVIETPFHTSGSSCFYLSKDNVCFSGDTLFHLSIGRSDLPTGSSIR